MVLFRFTFISIFKLLIGQQNEIYIILLYNIINPVIFLF